jgi:ATP-dependent Lon protease
MVKRSNNQVRTIKSRVPKNPIVVLVVKDVVAFPGVLLSLYLSRESSIAALSHPKAKSGNVLVVTQSNELTESPTASDLYSVGTVGKIAKIIKLSDGRLKVLIQGLYRADINQIEENQGVLLATVKELKTITKKSAEAEALVNRIKENLQVLVEHEHLPEEMLLVTEEIKDFAILTDVICAHYKMDASKAQDFLEESDVVKRLRMTDALITDDFNQFFISEHIRDQAKDELAKDQKEYYLREQLKQIQKELGEETSASDELAQIKTVLSKAQLPEIVKAEAEKQIKRLERMSPEMSEYALLRTYLEWIAELPWSTATKDNIQLRKAKEILDQDHFGLEKAKDRILEYLGVRKLNPDSKGPILCFVGPPGVGKTSLGKSIAKSLKRKFVRLSLGGVRDEAEIRGHRRTYVGALPGRIVQGLKQAGSNNPVIVLDELDKVGNDFRGDPASALLEVLDPEQNKDFRDHYLGVPFDLSNVMFISTANTIDTIPDALLDRLEIIFISGYTTEEKVNIAKRYLIPRQLEVNGVKKARITFSEASIIYLIERYTSEAGVRGLDREIGSVCRKVARELAERRKLHNKITPDVLIKILGPTKFDPELNQRKDAIGLARGLAWTIHGGEVMPVEASVAAGKGQLNMTGQLGDVMQESAQAAVFYARANAEQLGLEPNFNDKFDMHIHVPGGATPKDGPSAGITIATALVSALSKRPISKDYAMTGEITLGGTVLPIGGLKEKALAALRQGIKKIIIPFENVKDIEEIPKEQRGRIKFIPVKHISEVLQMVLLKDKPELKMLSTPRRSKNRQPSVSARS